MMQVLILLLFSVFLLSACSTFPGEIDPPYKSRVEAIVKELTDTPYSVHIVQNHPSVASIYMRSRSIILNSSWAGAVIQKNPSFLRAILAHEIAHVQLGHYNVRVEFGETALGTLLQELEFEADRGAIEILHARGFNPWDYWVMLQAFKQIEDKNPMGFHQQFYASHPYSGERLERVEKLIIQMAPTLKRPRARSASGPRPGAQK
jgi:hypothetical protein